MDVSILRSDALPLEGVIEARIQQTFDLGQGPQRSATRLDLHGVRTPMNESRGRGVNRDPGEPSSSPGYRTG